MSKYTIIGTLDDSSKFVSEYKKALNEEIFTVDLLSQDKNCGFGIGRALFDLSKIGITPSLVGIELMNLAVMVHIADGRLNRLQTSQDAWSREIKLILPVKDKALWDGLKNTLNKTLNFLTGDFWDIDFYTENIFYRIPTLPENDFPPLDALCLFSGGLDSTIGAIDLLEGKKRCLFISYAGGEGAVSSPQEEVYNDIYEHYRATNAPERLRLQNLRPPVLDGIGRENSTRGRSFLFFGLAMFAASGLKKKVTLTIPENGLIALNVPLDSTRLGSLSTRTTHPYYIHQWNAITSALGIKGHIENPYWNKTKGEMAKNCKNAALLKKIHVKTVSCAHPSHGRFKAVIGKHCRYCVPCLIRQAALNAAWGKGKDKTIYINPPLTQYALNALKAEGKQIRAFKLAAERVANTPSLAKLLIYKQGSLEKDVQKIGKLAAVYSRGMKEIGNLLKKVETYSER